MLASQVLNQVGKHHFQSFTVAYLTNVSTMAKTQRKTVTVVGNIFKVLQINQRLLA